MSEEKIYNLAKDKISSLGYELVRVKYFDKTKTLQIMIDAKDEGAKIGVEDCTTVSREMSVILDVEDVISKNYVLEVSSPGLDRPLIQMSDFKKYMGRKAKLLLKEEVEGVRKFKAKIVDINQENIIFELYDTRNIEVPVDSIESANLLIDERT